MPPRMLYFWRGKVSRDELAKLYINYGEAMNGNEPFTIGEGHEQVTTDLPQEIEAEIKIEEDVEIVHHFHVHYPRNTDRMPPSKSIPRVGKK